VPDRTKFLCLGRPCGLYAIGMTDATGGAPKDWRASDADREKTAEALREAAAEGRIGLDELDDRLSAVFAAKTYGELEPIIADLPAAGSAPSAPSPAGSASAWSPDRFGGQPTSSAAVAVMSGFNRKGNWTVPTRFTAVAFMGGGDVDMREARFAEREVTIRVFAVMGGIGITVPEDADVRVSGFGFMGGFDHGPPSPTVSGGPVIRIKGFAFWGGVGIKRRRPRGASGGDSSVRDGHDWRSELRDTREELRNHRDEWRREVRQNRDELRREMRRRRHDHRRELRRGGD
jgi:hypothetical protein